MRSAAIGLLVTTLACAPSLNREFREARAAAERSYSHGRYDQAARYWSDAVNHAPSSHHRNEAHYRAAASLARAGRHREAQTALATFVEKNPKSPRAPRAAYDRADIEVSHGDRETGYRLLESVFLTYPDAGVSRGALVRYLRYLEDENGLSTVRPYLDSVSKRLARTTLLETVHYLSAKTLEREGSLLAARDRFLYVAKHFPYPEGVYWDDSLANASRIEEQLGNYTAAIALLRRMLAEREPSHIQGSYERPRFSEAQYRIAELYRDRLDDPTTARKEFRRLWNRHETSVLRDDAKWNEARLAVDAGDRRVACRALRALERAYPDSRYVACASRLCPSEFDAGPRECRGYIVRQLDGEPSADSD